MSRNKEPYRDYATMAFIRYANLKRPTRKEYEESIRQDCYKRLSLHEPNFIIIKANAEVSAKEPLLKNIDAVNKVLEILKEEDKRHIIDAIEAVYFVNPVGKPKKGEISARVRRFAMEYPASDISVYNWLKSARLLYAKIAGLDTVIKDYNWNW